MSRKIKSTTINKLEYTGIVTLSQYIRGKKFTIATVHNAGGKPLFDFLADCLVGDWSVAKSGRPSRILLLNEDENHRLTKANDTSPIPLTSLPEKAYSANLESIVKYSFIVPQDIFAGTTFNAVGLYTGFGGNDPDVEDYAAYCFIGTEALNNISLSSVLVLDWELHISN